MLLHSILKLKVYIGFLNLSIINLVDGWPPHGTLVGKSEFLGEVLDISGFCDACKGIHFLLSQLIYLLQRLLFGHRSLLMTRLSTRHGQWRNRSNLLGDKAALL